MKYVILIVGGILFASLAILAVLILLWSVCCFLGGPDGRIGSPESFAFGAVYFFAGSFLMYLAVLGLRKINSLRRKSGG